MKKIIPLIVILFTVIYTNAQNKSIKLDKENNLLKENSTKELIKNPSLNEDYILKHLHIERGRKIKQCHGNGICIIIVDDGPRCPKSLISKQVKNRNISEKDAWAEFKEKSVDIYLVKNNEKFNSLIIDEKLSIEYNIKEISENKDLNILPGEYKIVYDKNGIGKTTLNIGK